MTLLRLIAFLFALAVTLAPMDAAARSIEYDSVSAEAVKAAADEYFAERFPDIASRLRVRVVRVGRSTADGSTLRLRLAKNDGVPRGHTQVKLLRETDGNLSEAGTAMIFVAHFDSVAVALRDISVGQELTPADVAAAWIEVTSFRGEPLRTSEFRARVDAEGAVARYARKAGEALRVDDIRPPFVVESGETVSMTYKRGQIVLRLNCKARESGVVGDIIRLYSEDSRTMYKARLTGPGRAEWVASL